VSEHACSVTLSAARGGWLATCSCGWVAKRPCWYKRRAEGFTRERVEQAERKRWGALPLDEPAPELRQAR
jgi:hypothetical protein